MQEIFQKVHKRSTLKYRSSKNPSGETPHGYEVLFDVKKRKLYDKEASRQLRRMEKLVTLALPLASLLRPLEKGEDAERKER